jgi:hypothetical protein
VEAKREYSQPPAGWPGRSEREEDPMSTVFVVPGPDHLSPEAAA